MVSRRPFLALASWLTLTLVACSDDTVAKEAGGPAKEASGPTKEASGPAKEASGPAKEASGPVKEASGPAKEASTCDLVGTWKGTMPGGVYKGQNLTWVVSAGGGFVGTIPVGTINGTWQLAGATLKVKDVSATPAYLACPPAEEGSYTLAFAAGCKTMTVAVGSDPCDGRKAYLDGFNPTRQ